MAIYEEVGYPFNNARRLEFMNRINSYIYTIFSAAAFIYGSLLCARHKECLYDPSQGSVLLLFIGLAIIISNYAVINLLIKFNQPESTFFQRLVLSVCIFLLIFIGSNLIVLKPFIQGYPVFFSGNMAFFFGVYLVIFGVSFLHYLLKNR